VEPGTRQDARIRLSVFQTCLREGFPPSVERLMGELDLSRENIEAGLDRLDKARHLKLVPGTHRILMAFPFSAVATPYRVVVDGGRSYFANCAWDAIAFHAMLKRPVRVESFCYHCGAPFSFEIRDRAFVGPPTAAPIVYLGLPASEWWSDIISTCSNTMLFFSSAEHLRAWKDSEPDARGATLSVDLMIRLSEPLYGGRLDVGFTRPSRDELIQLFQKLELMGEFWKI
jgi:Alkylmercury lyase